MEYLHGGRCARVLLLLLGWPHREGKKRSARVLLLLLGWPRREEV